MKALLRITVRKLCLPKSDTEKVLYVVEKCHEKTDCVWHLILDYVDHKLSKDATFHPIVFSFLRPSFCAFSGPCYGPESRSSQVHLATQFL
jgi:hypothetical protein